MQLALIFYYLLVYMKLENLNYSQFNDLIYQLSLLIGGKATKKIFSEQMNQSSTEGTCLSINQILPELLTCFLLQLLSAFDEVTKIDQTIQCKIGEHFKSDVTMKAIDRFLLSIKSEHKSLTFDGIERIKKQCKVLLVVDPLTLIEDKKVKVGEIIGGETTGQILGKIITSEIVMDGGFEQESMVSLVSIMKEGYEVRVLREFKEELSKIDGEDKGDIIKVKFKRLYSKCIINAFNERDKQEMEEAAYRVICTMTLDYKEDYVESYSDILLQITPSQVIEKIFQTKLALYLFSLSCPSVKPIPKLLEIIQESAPEPINHDNSLLNPFDLSQHMNSSRSTIGGGNRSYRLRNTPSPNLTSTHRSMIKHLKIQAQHVVIDLFNEPVTKKNIDVETEPIKDPPSHIDFWGVSARVFHLSAQVCHSFFKSTLKFIQFP